MASVEGDGEGQDAVRVVVSELLWPIDSQREDFGFWAFLAAFLLAVELRSEERFDRMPSADGGGSKCGRGSARGRRRAV